MRSTLTSTQPTVNEMIGTSGCLEVATGTYHLSVTDADATDTIDSEPAVTLDNILGTILTVPIKSEVC